MTHKHLNYYLNHFKQDLPAGIVVFLVALPLCLGIALASGAPMFSGVIAGMIGGILLSWLSGSQVSVSGPTAGQAVIILTGIEQLGSYPAFLLSVVVAGILQLILGFLRAGVIGAFFPSAVIKGMLAAIGLILIVKQIPHAVGYHVSFEGDESFMQETPASSFHELLDSFELFSLSSVVITGVSLMVLILWETAFFKRIALLRLIPGPLIVVAWGVIYNFSTQNLSSDWSVAQEHLVSLPVTQGVSEFIGLFIHPEWRVFDNPQVYVVGFTLAITTSLETLLSLEATDKLDPLKRTAPTNRELIAQGVGNILSGLIGGLPVTAVIVRSSVNINAGGRTRMSCFIHGILLTLSVMYFAELLNYIPLACLAAILLHTGYKLAKPQLFMDLYQQGMSQILPFVCTIVAILLRDLLQGIIIGIAIGLFFVIRANYHAAITLTQDGSRYYLQFNKDVSFLNKALLRELLLSIKENSELVIDFHNAQFVDHDILEVISDFKDSAPDDNIKINIIKAKVTFPYEFS